MSEQRIDELEKQISIRVDEKASVQETVIRLQSELDGAAIQRAALLQEKEQLTSTLQAFQQQREQLVQTVQQKHQEAVSYHVEAQRLAKICEDLQVVN